MAPYDMEHEWTQKFQPLQDQYSQSHQLQKEQMPYSSKLPVQNQRGEKNESYDSWCTRWSGFKQPKEDLNSSYAISRHFTGEKIKSFPIFFKHYAPHHIVGGERTLFCTEWTEFAMHQSEDFNDVYFSLPLKAGGRWLAKERINLQFVQLADHHVMDISHKLHRVKKKINSKENKSEQA